MTGKFYICLTHNRCLRRWIFEGITCTGTESSKQTREKAPKTQRIQNKQTGPSYAQKTL